MRIKIDRDICKLSSVGLTPTVEESHLTPCIRGGEFGPDKIKCLTQRQIRSLHTPNDGKGGNI